MFKKYFKRKNPEPEPQQTLRQRTILLWKWFSENADVFYKAIEDQNFHAYSDGFATRINEFFPGISWVFGPGPDEQGHSLTLSPEGSPYQSIVIASVIEQAPELPGWTFYSSRQASETFATMKMEIAGQSITAKEIWVTPQIDEDEEEIDLVCWAPVFENLPKEDRNQIIFLWLDEALGELKVTHRLGAIDINSDHLSEAIPLAELPEFVAEVEIDHQWKPTLQGQLYASYQMKERTEFQPTFLRSDIIGGTSLLHKISIDHIKEDGILDHPLPDWGVDFIFVSMPRSLFTKGQEVDERGEIEDAIQEKLDSGKAGKVLGGAFGPGTHFIDIMIFDGKKGIATVLKCLRRHPIGKAGEVFYFDKERASKAITRAGNS